MRRLENWLEKIRGRYQRTASNLFGRRAIKMRNRDALISFSFDDFPRSALLTGGATLHRYGTAGTYYISIGLMGQVTATGEMFHASDLELAIAQGHELGCHTFAHCHAFNTSPTAFERSIRENGRALRSIVAGAEFKTLSYPIASPRPATKRRCGRQFASCRGGGQTFNLSTIDLNNLSAFFLEQARDNPDAIKQLIDLNSASRGWLIFATHDVCDNPTRFGCEPAFFEQIVRYSVNSDSRVLTVSQALEYVRGRHI